MYYLLEIDLWIQILDIWKNNIEYTLLVESLESITFLEEINTLGCIKSDTKKFNFYKR